MIVLYNLYMDNPIKISEIILRVRYTDSQCTNLISTRLLTLLSN